MRLQKLWKCLAGASLAALTVAICAEPSAGQFPGGGDRGGRDRGSQGGGFQPGGGGGRGGFTADSRFDSLLQSYGGTGDAIDYSRIPPDVRERTNGFATRFGGEPMPLSGIITRAQYTEQFNARMAKMGQPGGGAPGAPPVASFTAPGAPPVAPGMPAPQAEMTDEQVLMAMRQLDRDGDNRISIQEASQSGRLSRVFQTYDKNADGFVDLAEFKGYMTDRMGNRVPSGDNNSPQQPFGQQPYGQQPYGQPNASYGTAPASAPEEQRPVVLRYGKMPKELPSWFNDLDTDKDGQVGMYEWRFDSRPVAEFIAMDLNGDGLLTAEEYLRFKNPVSNNATSSESRTITTSSSNPFNRNNTGPSRSANSTTSEESSNDKKDRKDEIREKKGKDRGTESGSNPFRR